MQSSQFHLHAEIEEKHWWFLGRRRIMTSLVHRLVPPFKKSVILDIGCGTGGNIAALASEYSCMGIDSSSEAIALAKKRFPQVEFRCCPMDSLDFGAAGSSADLFLLMDVLEHVEEDIALLSQIVSAAKPGAYFLVTVPADMALWSRHDVSFGHYRRYNQAQFEKLWAGLPVSALLVSHYNTRLYPIVRTIRTLNRLRGETSGDAGTDFRMPMSPINTLLEKMLAGEGPRLARILERKQSRGFASGVSLIAVLRRNEAGTSSRVC